MAEKIYTPVSPRESYFEEDPRAKLSSTEEELYKEVLGHFTKEGYVLPGLDNGALTDKEKFWLSRECFLRYVIGYCVDRVMLMDSRIAIFARQSGRPPLLSSASRALSSGAENMVSTIGSQLNISSQRL